MLIYMCAFRAKRERMNFIMINILLNGASGNMGKALCNYIKDSANFTLLYSIDKENSNFYNDITKKPDVIIDFSTPSATFIALDYAIKNLVPIVIATTGFSRDEENKIKEFSEAIPIFKSSNMSYGVNAFANLVASFAQKLNFSHYNADIEIIEKHHRNKVDAPSGTALMIADNINKTCNNRYSYVFDKKSTNKSLKKYTTSENSNTYSTSCSDVYNDSSKSKIRSKSYNEISFSSIRGGSLVGEHTVLFIGENESYELTHTAYSRNIYVDGALKAAEFIVTKKNGLYGMEDLLFNT